MAVLTDLERADVHAKYMRALSRLNEELGLTKADLMAAVDATDQWIDDNQASFNAALPLPARTTLTARQKVSIFLFVTEKRFGVI